MQIEEILDLARYPIDAPESEAYGELRAACWAELAESGMFSLAGFMHEAVAQSVADTVTGDLASQAFHHSRTHNIYFSDTISDVAPGHPAQQKFRTSNHTLCADQLEQSPVDSLYRFAPLRLFLADVMDTPPLYEMEDPLARLNVMSYGEGDGLNWHFDRSEFTVTLLLQAPDRGGVFEYRTGLRSQNDPNYEGVGTLLRGQDPKVQSVELNPGTLNVFRGANTAHRVTPTQGERARVIAVFSFFDRPGVRFSSEEQRGFYGRSA